MIVFGTFIITSHDYFPLTMASFAQLKAASMACFQEANLEQVLQQLWLPDDSDDK
jgi:hypothetical protein